MKDSFVPAAVVHVCSEKAMEFGQEKSFRLLGFGFHFKSWFAREIKAEKFCGVNRMAIWKITQGGPQKIEETKPKKEKLLEVHLENWIESDPSMLGEPLMIIGRQVIIPDVKDRLDLLALDPQGNAVVIELKRGELKDAVDMQGARYASYISSWKFEDFEKQAQSYFGNGSSDFNFNDKYEKFCAEAGVDESPDLNQDQRIILVGSEVKDRRIQL